MDLCSYQLHYLVVPFVVSNSIVGVYNTNNWVNVRNEVLWLSSLLEW